MGKEARMTVQQEASNLWLFESHNNSKRSQWLQSTLSELEEKTMGMLKLIEGDADTFAQRAEMYYQKRPELVNMIEDFYRSFRSLAERYDQLKLESGNSFSNQGFFPKEWSFIDKSSASSLIFDSESEVDDPPEEDQVESKLRGVPGKKNEHNLANLKSAGTEILQVRTQNDRSDHFTYSIDSELSEASYPGPEESEVESKLEEFPQKKSDVCVVKQMVEKVESTEVKARNSSDECFEHSESLYCEPKEGQGENNLTEFPEEKGGTNLSNSNLLFQEAERLRYKIKKMSEKSSGSSFEDWKVLYPKREGIRGENMLKESPNDKHDSDEVKIMSELERLIGENIAFKAELERKDEEKREVIRQLSYSMDIMKGENDGMRKFIRYSKNRKSLFEFRKLKGVFSRKLFGSQSKSPTTLVAI